MTRVKICGLMNKRDIDMCVQAGADTVGLVVDFPVPVPWNLTRSRARELIAGLPPYVGSCVVTGGPPESVLAVAEATRPNFIQLHHDESLPEVKELTCRLSLMGIKTIKALRVDREGKCAFEISDPVLAARQLARTNIAALLVDSYTGSLPGGTGIAVDLSVIRSIRQNTTLPLILAGGLNPENVAELIKATGPYAVDVLTGVETRPGQKDREKVMRFIQRARKEDYS